MPSARGAKPFLYSELSQEDALGTDGPLHRHGLMIPRPLGRRALRGERLPIAGRANATIKSLRSPRPAHICRLVLARSRFLVDGGSRRLPPRSRTASPQIAIALRVQVNRRSAPRWRKNRVPLMRWTTRRQAGRRESPFGAGHMLARHRDVAGSCVRPCPRGAGSGAGNPAIHSPSPWPIKTLKNLRARRGWMNSRAYGAVVSRRKREEDRRSGFPGTCRQCRCAGLCGAFCARTGATPALIPAGGAIAWARLAKAAFPTRRSAARGACRASFQTVAAAPLPRHSIASRACAGPAAAFERRLSALREPERERRRRRPQLCSPNESMRVLSACTRMPARNRGRKRSRC